MIFQSTRSKHSVSDTRAVLEGIAPDGGLYVDPELKNRPFDWRHCLTLSPLGMAEAILHHLLPDFPDMRGLVERAYTGKFDTPELTPLREAGEQYILELFHGPTSAFKDVALSMLPQLMVAARALEGERGETVILTATSGDTGKAALEGFHDVAGTRIFVFFPHGGVSPVQQLQMLTQQGANVQVCAVRGNFDDCQTTVKETFAALRENEAFASSGCRLSSANSINIGRLAPQLVYYFIAYARLIERGRIRLGDPVDYVVPTGNFGDILAGWMAKALGLPVGKLICASNANNVLTDFFDTGCYNKKREFFKTSSPSMDILVSSNLERLLFYVSGGDTALVADAMRRLNEEGAYTLPAELMEEIRRDFAAYCADEADTRAEIGRLWREQRYLCDPHTAVALHAARLYREEHGKGAPQVVLSTASPYKFPAAVLAAIGGDLSGDEFAQMETLSTMTGVPIPPNLAGLKDRAVRFEDGIAAADMADYICAKLGVAR